MLQSGRVAPKGWPNRNIPDMGLVSLFGDRNHAMVTAIRPVFLSTALGAPDVDIGVPDGFLTARTSLPTCILNLNLSLASPIRPTKGRRPPPWSRGSEFQRARDVWR